MAITRAQKEATLKELTEDLKNARGVVFTEYKGLTVAQINKMRRMLRAEKVKYQVIKLSLLKKALAALNISGDLKFHGPVAIAISAEEETTPARLLKAAAKEFPQLALDGGIFQSQIVASDVVERLASLPSKEQLLGQLVSVIAGPMRGLVTVLSGNTKNLLNVLQAMADSKK